MLRKFFYILLPMVFSLSALSQNVHMFGTGKYGYGGLSSFLINDMTQDSAGFIWVATDYGLNKFDGYRYKQYFKIENNPNSLLSNNIRTITIDSKGRLWVGSDVGLQYYESQIDGFETVTFPNRKTTHVMRIVELNNGEIWAVTDNGVYVVNTKTATADFSIAVKQYVPNTFVGCVYQDRKGNVWLGTEDKGLLKLNLKSKKIEKYQFPPILCMQENNKGDLYMVVESSIYLYDEQKGRFDRVFDPAVQRLFILKMIAGNDGNLYIGTNGQGLKYLDWKTNKIHSYFDNRNSIDYSTLRIPDLLFDKDGSLWIGCFQKGLMMIPHRSAQFNYIDVIPREIMLANTITAVLGSRDGSIWCGEENNGLYRFDRKGELISHFSHLKNITCIFEDADDNLWVGTYDKLNKVDKNSGQSSPLPIPFRGYYKTIAENASGELYISTFNAGFLRYNLRNREWKQYSMNQKDLGKGVLKNNWINAISIDADSSVWLGHYKGVSRFIPSDERFENIDDEELSSQICLSLLSDSVGNLYIGTYNGLFVFNKHTKQITKFSEKEGLSNNVICGLAMGENGRIWCSTFNGINQINTESRQIVSYFTGDGLSDKMYVRGIASQAKDKTIFFGNNFGIAFFNPRDIRVSNYDRSIRFTNLMVRNQFRNADPDKKDGFRFAFEDNNITFEFSTMDFSDVENIHYEYKLKGTDSDWNSTLSGVNQITFNYLNPGKYVLEVRACKSGIYSFIKEIPFVIDSPWYRTLPAYLLYILLLTAFFVLIFNLIQKKQKERINNLKIDHFINISHDIRSPLSLIVNPINKLLRETPEGKIQKTLGGVLRNTNRISSMVNQLLDIRQLDEGKIKLIFNKTEMVSFINELFDIFNDQAVKRGINFTFVHEIKELYAYIDRNNFDKILMNLLSNAFKFTPDNGEITVALDVNTANFRIQVIDSGIGFEEKNKQKLFERYFQEKHSDVAYSGYGIGLNITKQLVRLHHGNISANKRIDAQGSCFTIEIPLKQESLSENEPLDNTNLVAPIIVQQKTNLSDSSYSEAYKRRKTNFKVLIVDDDEDVRDYLKEELKSTYKVQTSKDGVEGLQMTLLEKPDIVISDVIMPKMDGFTLVSKIKSNVNISHIPVILLTSKNEHLSKIQGLKDGADAYLPKPFDLEELYITIHNLIMTRKNLKEKFSGTQEQSDKVETIDIKSNDEMLMNRIMSVINKNISNPDFNVEILSAEVGLSRSQLHRKMKEITGLSCSNFIRNVRLKQAEILLKERKQNITQIADHLGFSNQTHFSTSFKKHFGLSPTEYMERESKL